MEKGSALPAADKCLGGHGDQDPQIYQVPGADISTGNMMRVLLRGCSEPSSGQR